MNAEELWEQFCKEKGVDSDTPYEAWAFGGEGNIPDELAELVIKRKKFGTASAYDLYVAEDVLDELPKVGEYSVILSGDESEALCVIRTYEVYIRAFGDISPFHAFSEGEGDRSLEYWRQIHEEFFTPDLEVAGYPFTMESRVVCEKFTVEYVPGEKDVDDELLFVEPSMTFADEIVAYRRELLEADSSFDGCFSLKRHEDPKEFTDNCIRWSNPRREAAYKGSWGNVILCIRKSDMKLVGSFQCCNVLTETMEKYTGGVGYCVRPSERRKGYAKRILAYARDFLSCFGLTEFVITCLPENEGSKKTILANGGEYIETVFLEEDGVYLEKYRIKI